MDSAIWAFSQPLNTNKEIQNNDYLKGRKENTVGLEWQIRNFNVVGDFQS